MGTESIARRYESGRRFEIEHLIHTPDQYAVNTADAVDGLYR